jgi:alkylhydroperoxidase/carboxymuconolactone decarboxylase family protein YurZ
VALGASGDSTASEHELQRRRHERRRPSHAGRAADRAHEGGGGYIYPEWELAARTDPDFTDAYNRIYELALGEGRYVSAKVREFVAIALLAFRGADHESLVAHMRRAIRLGATKEELFEVLEATLVPGGAPTFHRGLSALIEVE